MGASLTRLLVEAEMMHTGQHHEQPGLRYAGKRLEWLTAPMRCKYRQVCEGADVIYLCLNAHYVDWYALFPPRLFSSHRSGSDRLAQSWSIMTALYVCGS